MDKSGRCFITEALSAIFMPKIEYRTSLLSNEERFFISDELCQGGFSMPNPTRISLPRVNYNFDAIDEYYNLMLKSIQTCEFQAMAHIDFPRRYFDNWNVSDTIMDEILNAMIKKDIILEVNTSSIMNASDEPLPRYSIIDRYVQLGGRRVVLGSDAHISVKLGNAFSSVVRKLPNTCVIGYFKNRVFYEL